jgi:probable HAF family extracellular repeat protein
VQPTLKILKLCPRDGFVSLYGRRCVRPPALALAVPEHPRDQVERTATIKPEKQPEKHASMDSHRTFTSGKGVSASQRDLVTAPSNQATICKPWKSLAAVAFGLLLSVPGLTQAQHYNFITSDVPNATATAVNGNSPNAIAGEYDDAQGAHGFVLNNNGAFTKIDAPPALAPGVVPGVVGSFLNGINASGRLVGTYVVFDGNTKTATPHAFFYNNGNFLTLDPFNVRSQGGSINAQGQVVGTYRDVNQKRHGFIWRNGAFTTFNVPNDDSVLGTVAFGINDTGAVVGDYVVNGDVDTDGNANHRHGFLRSSSGVFTTFDVPVPGADITIGEGINNAGAIVGVYVDNSGLHGFVLNNGVFTYPVDVPNSSGTEINSINANRQIVGFYFDSDGVQHGFVGVPVH